MELLLKILAVVLLATGAALGRVMAVRRQSYDEFMADRKTRRARNHP